MSNHSVRIIWKHRQAMVEKLAEIKVAHHILKGSEFVATEQWWKEHINQYAAFEIGNVVPSDMGRIKRRFLSDVRRLRDSAIKEYFSLSESEQAAWRERIIARMQEN